MILVDTSVWIRFLANKAPYALQMDELLGKDEVVGHEFVYGELLLGDRGSRSKFLATYQEIRRASFVPNSEVAAFVRDRGLQGRGIGWIDAHLIASALIGRFQLWTADKRLSGVARELGVAYLSV
jgi:predicted nucleic acid-binding protein